MMATAAVCITGLTVIDVATEMTTLGQVIYLILIQIGGIGILTITTMIILWLGGRIRLRSEAALGAPDRIGGIGGTRALFRAILRYAVGIEVAGAILLWLAWLGELGPKGAIWPAIFHSISAFTNAGVSNLEGGLAPYQNDPLILTVIMALIILGGLGFLVLEELSTAARERRRTLSLHTRLVLLTTAVLIIGGTVAFALLEWNVALRENQVVERIFQAAFLSITPRTAGFTIVDYKLLSTASITLTILLMMIGGSPGSTAGGLKTTTLAVLVALAYAKLRGETTTHAFKRTIPETTIQRATGLVIIGIATLAMAILVLQVAETRGTPHQTSNTAFLDLTFDAVAAFNTTGLSLGAAKGMTTLGKGTLALLMYIGRIGPLTLAASMMIAAGKRRPKLRYSTEDLIIG